MKKLLAITAGIVGAAALAGSWQVPAYAAAKPVLTVGTAFAPLGLDPSISGNGRAGTMLMPAYEPLVRTRPDGTFVPALATKWVVSPDFKSVTFTLRANAKFSDGTPVTAQAVKNSINYWVNKKGPFSVNLASLTSIDVLGPTEVKLNFSTGNPDVLYNFNTYWLAGDIIGPAALKDVGSLRSTTDGAGAYVLDPAQTVSGKSYTYVPNKYYYDPAAIRFSKIIIDVIPDANAAIAAMKAGQVQFLVSDALTANANHTGLPKNLRIIADPVQWVGMFVLDRDGVINPALKHRRVRQALNYGIDRQLVSKALLGAYALPTDQIQGKGFMGHDDALEARYPYDPAKAKALLKAAGYPNGIPLTISYSHDTFNATLAQAFAGQYQKIGVKVTIDEKQNFGALIGPLIQKKLSAIIFTSNSDSPNIAKFQTLMPNGSLNPFHSTDPKLEALIAAASALPSDKAASAWQKVYARVVELGWFVPLAATDVVYFVSDKIVAHKPRHEVVIDLMDLKPAK
ncbi:MAG: hypothetical protein KGQ37_01860 [Hyphomicrobiales bacterium]|nr:hypothetical protein [Hyphomicrobiales bacterium]